MTSIRHFGRDAGKAAAEVHAVNLLTQGLRGWKAYRQAVKLSNIHLKTQDKQLNALKQRGRLLALFQPNRAALLVSEKHQQVTGTCMLLPVQSALKQAASSIAMLYSVVVAPEARGSGLGKQLVSRALEEANKRQYDYLVLTSKPGAAGFYKKLGFHSLEEADASLPKPLKTLERQTAQHPLYQGKSLFWRSTLPKSPETQSVRLDVAA